MDDTGRAVPTLQLLVHTGSGRWPEAHRPLTCAGPPGGYLTSEPIAMLDVGGQHRDDAWPSLRPQTETAAFTCLTLLQRDMTKLAQRGRDMIPAYALHMQQLFRQLYNLSCSRDWEAHGLDDTISRWITGTIMSYVTKDKYFAPNFRTANSLREIVMTQNTLVAEMEAGWDQVREGGRARGEERRLMCAGTGCAPSDRVRPVALQRRVGADGLGGAAYRDRSGAGIVTGRGRGAPAGAAVDPGSQ